MSANVLSSANLSLVPPPPPHLFFCLPNSSLLHPHTFIRSRNCLLLFYPLCIINFLDLLLLFVFIVHLSCRRCRVFVGDRDVDVVYHSMAMQLKQLLGIALYFYSGYSRNQCLVRAGINILTIGSHGQLLLHLLTCVERYVAVVHPVFFMRLTKACMAKLRNLSMCCIWLMCCMWMIILHVKVMFDLMAFHISFTLFLSIVISLCTAVVLCALRRPRPGEGRTRRVDQSKERAFRTMLAILSVLLFRLLGNLYCAILVANAGQNIVSCVWVMFISGFDMPSNSILPVLYLHRTRKRRQSKK